MSFIDEEPVLNSSFISSLIEGDVQVASVSDSEPFQIVLHCRAVSAYSKKLPISAANSSEHMDVSGTIRAILNRKSGEVFSISPDAVVFQAIEMMDKKNVGALLVMEEDRLIGIISERDYTRKVILCGRRSRETKVAEIMAANLTVTHPRESVEKCLRLMTDKRIRHLPVLDGDKVVGVISIGDLVKWTLSCQSAAIAHLENYIHGGYTG